MRVQTLSLVVLVIAGCPASTSDSEPSGSSRFGTVEATLATIVKAVRTKDMELYKECFTKEAHEKGESALKKFEKNAAKTWAELNGLFRGPQSIGEREVNGDVTRVRIKAPEAQGGGIGSMRFRKVAGEWKIDNW